MFDSLLNLPDARARPPCARLAQRILDHLAAHPGLQQRAQAELAQQASQLPLATFAGWLLADFCCEVHNADVMRAPKTVSARAQGCL